MADAVSVTLGGMGEKAREWIKQGRYASMSEVVREGLRALERQEEILDAYFKLRIAEAMAETEPPLPLDDAMAQVRQSIEKYRT